VGQHLGDQDHLHVTGDAGLGTKAQFLADDVGALGAAPFDPPTCCRLDDMPTTGLALDVLEGMPLGFGPCQEHTGIFRFDVIGIDQTLEGIKHEWQILRS
jgi:hypothetical protein